MFVFSSFPLYQSGQSLELCWMSHPLKVKTWKCIQLDSPNKHSIGEDAFPNTTPYKVGILVFILQRRELLWNAKHLFKLVQRKSKDLVEP